MDIVRGYEPVTKLDTNIMASRHALVKMGFPKAEVDKREATFRARKQLPKFTKIANRNIQKVFKREKAEWSVLPEPLSCDICKKSVYFVLKRFAPEEYHGDWLVMQFTPEKADEPRVTQLTPEGYDGERTYTVLSPGIVIDYNGGKVYVVCGLCQFRLGLQETESGLLIHGIKDGHGYVDLDRIEKFIKEEENK